MKRSVINWLLFCICALLILGAMGLMTHYVLALEKKRITAEVQADVEERKRLAISRMDSVMASFLLIENQRPPLHYQSLIPSSKGTNVLSPILSADSVLVRLYFKLNAVAAVSSPQVPQGGKRELAMKAGYSSEKITEASRDFEIIERLLNQEVVLQNGQRTTWGESTCTSLDEGSADWNQNKQPDDVVKPLQPKGPREVVVEPQKQVAQQKLRSKQAKSVRAAAYKDLQQRSAEYAVANTNVAWAAQGSDMPKLVSMDSFTPFWIGEELAFLRQVRTDRSTQVQGIWLQKAEVQRKLLEMVRDLFPEGELEKVELPPVPLSEVTASRIQALADDPDVLVSLPYRFHPGKLPDVVPELWTPLKRSLLIGWGAAAFALLAVLFLMRGIMKLSERRAAFVSSVTHELRTPLTTFRLYSEMLADGMVTDPVKRDEYLQTMLGESERLNHLVENVLAYSQIEKGSARRNKERLTLKAFLDKLTPLLERRVAQEGAQLILLHQPTNREVEIDVTSVEQIIFNLVDNACKYGIPSGQSGEIILDVSEEKGRLVFTVTDQGKGIPAGERKRLFKAFHKSAQDAAEGKPGVGLGLALCRRLARAMGGDLRLDSKARSGSSFVFHLPQS